MNQSIEDLRAAILEAEYLLLKYGDKWLPQRMADLYARLGAGDLTAVGSALSEATGSAGSLSDRHLSPISGDPIDESESDAVNARLRAIVRTIAERANAVRASMPITPLSEVALVTPAIEHLADYVVALERGWSPDNVTPTDTARQQLAAIARDPQEFLATLEDREAKGEPIKLPDGSLMQRLPGITRWLWQDGFCGSIGFRWQNGTSELPPNVLGHIGFTVVPWRRGKGHAKRALGLMLNEARAVGLNHVYLTTNPKNLASQVVIAANAGILIEWFHKDAAYGGGEGLKFRIRL